MKVFVMPDSNYEKWFTPLFQLLLLLKKTAVQINQILSTWVTLLSINAINFSIFLLQFSLFEIEIM